MTFRRLIPSYEVMRRAIASSMTLLLVTIVAACSLLGCAFGADFSTSTHACCHKHSQGTPCAPKTKMQQCAYNLLERSKTSSAQVSTAAAPVAGWLAETVSVSAYTVPQNTGWLANSGGLHLRIHVLLI